ncbi:MAG: GAF domain-containing sensor histidine kinase [Anaerolineales bacterium]|nr:GAF domain-containing sensor histidine kinase [Anaerolineales bacterium]
MNARRWVGLGVVFVIATVGIAAALRLGPEVAARFPALPAGLISGGVAAGLAFGLVALAALVEALARDERPADTTSQGLILKFNQRTVGVLDEETLARAAGDLLAESLQVRVSGWLLLTPREAALTVRPVPARGEFPVVPLEFARHNVLLRQLNQRHEPVRQAELEADAHYSQTPAAERQWLKQLNAEVYTPVFEGGLLTAVLVAGPREGRRPFRPADLELIALLAAQTGAAWKAIQLQNEVRQLQAAAVQLEARLREKDEAVVKMDNSRGDFLAIASHELRTPITQLLGFADLLGSMARENSLDVETVVQITDSIVRACARLNEVINQIMDMAQLDVNALDLKFKTCTLDVLLRPAIEPYVPAMRERRLALRITGLKDLPPLQGDEHRLVQAFSQLMSNAVKYTPDGGKIEISARLLPAENNLPPHLELVFADGGIGIDPRYHALIFDKFFRIGSSSQHSTSTTKFMGAGPGLGLPIAKGVIERHGGRIWVESDGHDPARLPGSRFYVRLPLKPPAFDPRALPAADEPFTGAAADRLRDSRPNIPRTPFIET